jgi:alanine-glyoxylate transaminase/serine-glyoxylate transaminase/serine-pyruvate transaminase
MLYEEGLEHSWARHQRNHKALKAGLETFGTKYLVDEKYRLPQLNSVFVPDGVDEKEVRRRLLAEYNLEIGAGLGDFAGKIWRFGLMGYSSKIDNVMLCLGALETVFSDMGKKIDIGAAQAAAHKVYEANPLNAVPVKQPALKD